MPLGTRLPWRGSRPPLDRWLARLPADTQTKRATIGSSTRSCHRCLRDSGDGIGLCSVRTMTFAPASRAASTASAAVGAHGKWKCTMDGRVARTRRNRAQKFVTRARSRSKRGPIRVTSAPSAVASAAMPSRARPGGMTTPTRVPSATEPRARSKTTCSVPALR